MNRYVYLQSRLSDVGGSGTIEGLALDMRKVEQGMRSKALELKTSSLANMDKLKLLQLKNVKLTGCYENFPEFIWLCWHGCPLQIMPPGLLMSSLVAIDMSDGHLEKFEAPTGLNSLKYLSLKGCDKLVSICNLYRLPKLDTLILWNCSSLTHLCKSTGDLEYLDFLDLTGCTKLLKYVKQPETMMVPQKPLLSLPRSLMLLDLINCDMDHNNDVYVAFHARSLFVLCLAVNPFEYLPSNINLKMLRILNLYSCPNLKSISCIPSTLLELHIDWCISLERVTFQSGRFTLQGCAYECCFKLSEIQGLFKLVSVAETEEAELGHMQWIKAYEDHKVELVGDEITKGKIWHTQVLYEYGIMSTYLQGIDYRSMMTSEYTSSSLFLFFCVPFHHEKNRIQGLNVSCLYRLSGSKDNDELGLLAKISNRSKGLTWVYNPLVYCKPKVDEDVVWLSYWPIGNILDAGDAVTVGINADEAVMVSQCGASLVYVDDSEEDEEENFGTNTMKEEEEIGGDLSEFEVTTGGYYLSRRDLFGPETSYWLKWLFGDNVHYTDSHGWRKSHQSKLSWMVRDFANTFLRIIELGVSFNNQSEIYTIEKAVSSLVGIESVSTQKDTERLIVVGCVDPIEVVSCVRELGNMAVKVLSVKYKIE
ncbi:uncharacterized protein LOC110874159 [Helianthus annuus]|uniref:uncharacterized protein LOC110874159 n=1 Tax=Helianthus annuus TaxID=4232 RepID=UPI001652E227|nr:uncharacterized protein LOC110874159 [Helianthus annuus]